MTTAAAIHATEVILNAVSLVHDIPLSRIRESKTNPIRQFDETRLAELADKITLRGVLQPILVHPLPGGEAESYELVAGARRYRASKLAKCESIPATIRELTDPQCLELQLIENLQRADVHELDEARGYAALMHMQPDTCTVETLAEKIGRSEKYVYARLRLTHLVEDVQWAFYDGKLSVAHAFEMARLEPDDQKRALQECFPNHRTAAGGKEAAKDCPGQMALARSGTRSRDQHGFAEGKPVRLNLGHGRLDVSDAEHFTHEERRSRARAAKSCCRRGFENGLQTW
jgi:ParB/RepB/Spo0J family partition protein